MITLPALISTLLLLLLTTPVISKGINCQGRSECSRWSCVILCDQLKSSIPDLQSHMEQSLRNGYGGQAYLEHQLIACMHDHSRKGAFCAFYQNVERGDLFTATKKLGQLDGHGCHLCGSAPLVANDIKDGEVTVNFIKGGGDRVGCTYGGDGMCTRNVSRNGQHW